MIVEKPHAPITKPESDALEVIRSCPEHLYPTGSRFFGTNSLNSDFDFYTKRSDAFRKFLLNNGFYEVMDEQYSDLNTCWVLRRDNVDIQFVHDCEVKFKIQSLIKLEYLPLLHILSKDKLKLLWSLMYSLYWKGKKDGAKT